MPVPQLIRGRSARRAAPGLIGAALLLCNAASAAPTVTTTSAPEKETIFLGASLLPPTAALRFNTADQSVTQPSSAIPVSVGYTWRGVAISGRKLDTSEWKLQGDVSPHVSLWYANQHILAKGRLGHKEFETSGNRYGGQADLYGGSSAAKELTGSFEVFQAGQGKATAPSDFVTYNGTQTETVSFALTTRGLRMNQQYLVTASHVHGGDESANVLGGGYGVDVPLGAKLRGSVDGILLSEQGSGSSSTHPVFDVGLSYRPVSWARLEAGAVAAPNGFAVAGSALTGLTSFLIYKPGGAAQELAGQRSGFGVLRLVLTQTF